MLKVLKSGFESMTPKPSYRGVVGVAASRLGGADMSVVKSLDSAPKDDQLDVRCRPRTDGMEDSY